VGHDLHLSLSIKTFLGHDLYVDVPVPHWKFHFLHFNLFIFLRAFLKLLNYNFNEFYCLNC